MNQLLLDRVATETEDGIPRFDPDPCELANAGLVLPEWIIATIEYSLGASMPAAMPAAQLLGLA